MTWRDKLKVSRSNAEELVQIELQRRGLTDRMVTQKPFKFDPEEDGVEGTWSDYFWNPPYDYAVFLDYEKLHLKSKQAERDVKVTEALERRGIIVDRFEYRVIPISKRRVGEICDSIRKRLNEVGTKYNLHV